MALGSSTLSLLYVLVLASRVAHELQFPVWVARYAIGAVARVPFGGHAVIAIDLVSLPIEAAAVGSSAG